MFFIKVLTGYIYYKYSLSEHKLALVSQKSMSKPCLLNIKMSINNSKN